MPVTLTPSLAISFPFPTLFLNREWKEFRRNYQPFSLAFLQNLPL